MFCVGNKNGVGTALKHLGGQLQAFVGIDLGGDIPKRKHAPQYPPPAEFGYHLALQSPSIGQLQHIKCGLLPRAGYHRQPCAVGLHVFQQGFHVSLQAVTRRFFQQGCRQLPHLHKAMIEVFHPSQQICHEQCIVA